MEHVNHPKHYNQHPAGIECIDIIRHYTCDIANAIKYLWRAGLKPEMGKEDAEKEIEDLKKALWYIEDYHSPFFKHGQEAVWERKANYELSFKETTGYTIGDICNGYPSPVKEAMENLLYIGFIHNGCIAICSMYRHRTSVDAIHQRILDIERQLLNKELESTMQVLHGQAVDGMDYVSKPGCVRETEPEHYDPLNMIVAWGRVYSLTDEVRKKDNGALYSPCENCDLWSECHDWKDMPTPMLDESKCHYLCARIHGANDQQYYREVGKAKYSPKFGTVEVVDEMKELKQERKQLQEDEE
jgi:hypothetical protein